MRSLEILLLSTLALALVTTFIPWSKRSIAKNCSRSIRDRSTFVAIGVIFSLRA